MVLIRTTGFRRVVDDLDREEWFLARNAAPPQRAKGVVVVKSDAASITQIGGDAVRLFASTVALDHDAPEIRARHALDRLD